MDGYDVQSPELKEIKRLIVKGDWSKPKSMLKDLFKREAKFKNLCQIDKCFISRFLGERYKADRKFQEAIRFHSVYLNASKGLPVEEQRAFATLGSTYHDYAIEGSHTDLDAQSKAFEKAEAYHMKAVHLAKDLLACHTSSGIGKTEAGHMMARGLYNVSLIGLSKPDATPATKANATQCLEKAIKVMKSCVFKTKASSASTGIHSYGAEAVAFQITLLDELAQRYKADHRLQDLWKLSTDGVQLAEKALKDAEGGMSRVKATRQLSRFLMFKAHASLGECHFDIATKLSSEALQYLVKKKHRVKHKKAANEYAADFEEDDELLEDEQNLGADMSTEIIEFKKISSRLSKISKKVAKLQRSKQSSSRYLEKIADLLFDLGIYEQSRLYYEKALEEFNLEAESDARVGIIVSIGRCLLALGNRSPQKFGDFISSINSNHMNNQKAKQGLYEAAVDSCVDSSAKSSELNKWMRLEMDEREKKDCIVRIAEVYRRIDVLKSQTQISESLSKEFQDTIDEIAEDLSISKKDISKEIERLENENGGLDDLENVNTIESDDLEDSSCDSDDDEIASTGNENSLKPNKEFNFVRLKRNEKGETQLHIACRTASIKKAEDLLKGGHPVNVCDGSGYFPIHDAADAGSAAIVALLIDSGADVDLKNDFNGLTPAMEAARNSYIAEYRNVLRVLVNKGYANCDAKDNKGRTPLHFLREARREQEHGMSSDDLADWMETESLLLSKMKKKPSVGSSFLASSNNNSLKQESSQCNSIDKNISSSPSKGSLPGKNNRRKMQSSSSESEEENETSGKSAGDDDAVNFYQAAIGGIGKSAKRKVLESQDEDSGKAKRLKKAEAMKELIANDPFLNPLEPDWLIDDVGKSKKPKVISSTGRQKQSKNRQNAKKSLESLEILEEQKAVNLNEEQAVMAASAIDIENVDNFDKTLRSMFAGDGDSQQSASSDIQKPHRSSDLVDLTLDLPDFGNDSNFLSSTAIQNTSDLSRSYKSIASACSGTKANIDSHDDDFLTIRVHLERDDPSVPGGRKRDSLLINSIDPRQHWDIKRLRQETKQRYTALFGQSPVISFMRLLDGTTLADDSRLAPIARQQGELLACIDRWDLPPISDRLKTACDLLLNVNNSIPELALTSITQTEASGKLELKESLLSGIMLHCVFKALMHQSNLTSLCLSGNRMGSSSRHVNSLAMWRAFVDLVGTLPNLLDLDLSLCNISSGDFDNLASALTTSKFQGRIRRLNFSYNCLKKSSEDQRLSESFSTVIKRLAGSHLRRLVLVSAGIDGKTMLLGSQDRMLISETFSGLHELAELDLSHNKNLCANGFLDFLLARALLPIASSLTVLRLDGLFPVTGYQPFIRLICHALSQFNRLAELSLSSNGAVLDSNGIIELAKALPDSRSLSTLDLSANIRLSSSSFTEIAKYLTKCQNLSRLDLSATAIASPLDLEIFNYLVDKMDSTTGSTLYELVLPKESNFSNDDVSSLRQVLNAVGCSTTCTLQFN